MQKASKSNKYHYNSNLTHFARKLRNNGTKAEACLWKYLLRAGTFKGYKFRRQRPVLNYIADFMCTKLMLIIEVDGISHQNVDAIIRDEQRTKELKKVGFTVLRFSDDEVLNDILNVERKREAFVEEFEENDNGRL